MNQEWSLDALYTGYDDPNFVRDMERIPEEIEAYRGVIASLQQEGDTAKQLRELLTAEERLEYFAMRLSLFIHLKQAVNSSDEQAAAASARLHMQLSTTNKDSAIARKWMASLDNLEELAASDPLIAEYEDLLRQAKKEG